MTDARPPSASLSVSPSDLQASEKKQDALQPRTVNIRQSVETYSRFVSTMKILLPSVAVVLLVLVVVLPQLRNEPEQFTAEIERIEGEGGSSLSLVNARYFGTDESGQPFSVTAKSVRESNTGDAVIDLTAPQADISLNDGTWLTVGAETGSYQREAQVLDLMGAVNLFQDQGYELHTDAVTIMLEEGRARSSTPVSSQGPFGQLESQGFLLQDKGKTVLFTGPARLVLNSVRRTAGGQ